MIYPFAILRIICIRMPTQGYKILSLTFSYQLKLEKQKMYNLYLNSLSVSNILLLLKQNEIASSIRLFILGFPKKAAPRK